MAKRSLTGANAPTPIKKRTSIGDGRRKRSSFKRSKKYRGQGK